MRGFRLGVVVTVALLVPKIGNAQVFQFGTPPPEVSAASALWQINSDPLIVAGVMYFPTRAFRVFDGQVMVQTGIVDGIPVYSDSTIEPLSELYVPLTNGRMRVYERRRRGELAGTTGSHLPTFPVQDPFALEPDRLVVETDVPTTGAEAYREVGTGGTMVPRAVGDSAMLADRVRPRRVAIGTTSAPRPGVADGVWLEYNGARWYSSGPSVSFSTDRFEPIGEYRGFPVYRDRIAGTTDIWVSVVKDGPLAPYGRR